MKILETTEQNFLKIIKETLKDNSHLGDDCAILPEFNLAISEDSLVEGVHFDLNLMKPYELGKKSALVNISDVLASGAKPKYLLVSLSGELDNAFVKSFYEGVNEICEQFNVEVVGGDLTSGDRIVVSICALGNIKNRNISSRKNAKPSYVVCAMGNFGVSTIGLSMLKLGRNEFTHAHTEPQLYPEVVDEIALKTIFPYAMMDSSDGLLDCLAQISRDSKVKIEVEYDKIPKKIDDKKAVLFGGEDYSLVICMAKNEFERIKHLGLVQIGQVSDGMGIFVDGVDYSDIDWGGYKHFEN